LQTFELLCKAENSFTKLLEDDLLPITNLNGILI